MIFNSISLERAYEKTKERIPPHFGMKMRQRRQNALDKAYEFLQTNPYVHYENGKLIIMSESRTKTGAAKYYETTRYECRLTDPENLLCHAFWEGNPCYHRAALEIIENYWQIIEKSNSTNAPQNSAAAFVPIVNS